MRSIKFFLSKPKAIISSLIGKMDFMIPNDKFYLSIKYWLLFDKNLDWKEPQNFSEKLQWLKLYDRNPLYTKLVDKYSVKDYVKDVIGGGI